jgi:hypothetical protein
MKVQLSAASVEEYLGQPGTDLNAALALLLETSR